MTERRTDRRAIRLALEIAIDTEESMIDAYNMDESHEAVKDARRNIESFKRVLDRYYGGGREDPFAGAKKISVFDLLKDVD